MSVRVGSMPTGIAWGSYLKITPESYSKAKEMFSNYLVWLKRKK